MPFSCIFPIPDNIPVKMTHKLTETKRDYMMLLVVQKKGRRRNHTANDHHEQKKDNHPVTTPENPFSVFDYRKARTKKQ